MPSPRRLLLLLPLVLCLTQCQHGQNAGSTAFRYGHKFVTGDIPRVSRYLTERVKRLMRNDGSFWEADGVPGKPRILIVLGEQKVYLLKNGQVVGGSPISSGQEGYDTRPGKYRVIEKDIDHKSSIYGDYEDYNGNVIAQNIDNRKDRRPPGTRFEGAKMFYFMRIYGGVGMK